MRSEDFLKLLKENRYISTNKTGQESGESNRGGEENERR